VTWGPGRPPAPAGDGRCARVLIVDDDPDILRLARRILQRHGYTVATAGDGLAALAQIAREPPDVLLTDLMMPALDGVALVRELQRQDAVYPIIVCSAAVEVALEEVRLLRKPFGVDALVQAVADALDAPPT
jgi:CheY-like chemotaxis protein